MLKKSNFQKSSRAVICIAILTSQVVSLPTLGQAHIAPTTPHHVWTGNHSCSNPNSSISGTRTSLIHHHIHHINVGANQPVGTNGHPDIGSYHAGYMFHHGGEPSLNQQNTHTTASVSLHNHSYNSFSASRSQTGNAQTSYQHHNNLNNQTAITLSGSKSANGSLLGSASLPNLFNLDLGSSKLVIQASNSLPITITLGGYLAATGNIMGGRQMVIEPGKMLTAAQYTAMEQVITSGSQTVVLSQHGTAISGLVTLVAGQVSGLADIQVPTHVLVDTVGFSSSNPLNIAGTTQILGSLYTLEQSTSVTAALNSASIFVGARGTLGDPLTNQNLFNNLFAANGLNLSILGNLTNQGTVNSIGTLNVSANQVANVSTNNHQAVMSAPIVNIYTASGNVTNSGQIIAGSGNVQFNTAAAQNININNTKGVIQALQGSIDVRDLAYAGNANLNLSGGDWLSQNLNLNSGSGIATANIGNVTGAINTNAGEAHVLASTQNLIIGNTALSGDPSYFNTLGKVTIAGNLNFSGQDLAIVAKTNIVTAAGAGSINTSSSIGNGGNITMIAGANFTSSGPAQGNNNHATTLTVNGGTAAGGYIDLSGNISGSGASINTLTSASSAVGGNGGNISLVAYGGTAGQSGKVSLPTAVTVTSGGSGSGNNGSVTVIAGANAGTGINVGAINTTGGTGVNGGGDITLATAAPALFSNTGTMTIKNGSITNGASFFAGNLTSASIVAGALTSPGGFVAVEAGKAVTTGTITSNGVGANGNGGYINVTAARNTDAHLQVNGDLSANGVGTGSGGTANISYSGSTNVSGVLLVGASNAASNYVSGNISADSGLSGTAGGNVNISSLVPGPLSINPGVNERPINVGLTGTISANGSSLGNVNFYGKTINVTGPGALTGITNNNSDAAAVTYTVGSGNLTLGQISNASGNIVLTNNATNGIIQATQSITSAGKLIVNGGAAGSLVVPTGVTISGTAAVNTNAVNIQVPNVILNGSVLANSGDIVIRTTAPGNPLNINMGNGSSINAAAGNVSFNNGVNTPIVMTSGFGDISASAGTGLITLHAHGYTTSINVNSLKGNLTGDPGTANITVAAGNLNILGPFTTAQLVTLTNNAAGGSVNFNGGTTTASTVTVKTTNTGSVLIAATAIVSVTQANVTTATFTNNGAFTASSQPLTIQGNGTNNALIVSLGAGSTLSGDSVVFNGSGASAGAINMLGGNGAISATGANPTVIFNGGTGAVNVNVNSINGETVGQGGSVALTVHNGQLALGSWTSSSGAMSFTNTFASGGVQVANSLTSVGQLSITSGSAAGINIATSNVLSGKSVSLSAGTGGITLNGTSSIVADSATGNAGNISIISNGGAINLGTGIISAQATGNTGSGGTITISGLSFVAHNEINANAAKTGNGGSISISTVGSASDLTVDNTFTFSAQGGTTSGNGGTASFSAGRNLTIASTASMNVSARAANGNGGKINLTNGTSASGTLQINQSLAVNGNGSGSGGQITISNNSSSVFLISGVSSNGINGTLMANAGSGTGGGGGSVSVTNRGSGGIALLSYSDISVNPSTGGGAGGSITLNAGNGLLTIPNGTINVSAIGPGSHNGGTISLTGSSVVFSGGTGTTLSLLANAAGSGNGGSVSVRTTSANGDIILGNAAGDIATISATGGSAGFNAGNGGFVTLNAGRNLIIPSTIGIVKVIPAGNNGNGGTISLTAGAASSSGILQANQALNADGTGTGNGGTVSVSYNDTINPLIVGATGPHSYVIGNISSSAGAFGTTGGTVNITDTGNGPLSVTLTGSILASGNTLGNINFASHSGQAINVTGPGALTGTVNNNATAAAVTYKPGTGNLVLGSISNATGNILAVANPNNGSVITTKNITSAGTLTFTSASTGSVSIAAGTTSKGTTAVTVNSPKLNIGANGALTATTGNVNILSNTLGNALSVNLANGASINALAANVAFNSTTSMGPINITSGFGSITADGGLGNISLNAGNNSPINVNVFSLTGIVTGTGSIISIASAANNLSLGALTSAVGGITISNAGNGNTISTSGNINSAQALVISQTSSTGSIILGNSTTAGGTAVTTTSQHLTLTGNAALKANTSDVNILGTGSPKQLILSFGSGSSITSVSGNVNFNSVSAPGSIITTSTGNGSISANGGAGIITLNGGAGASSNTVRVNVNSIAGTAIGNGSAITLAVARGNLLLGAFISYANASSGNIAISDSSTNGTLTTTGNITSAGSLSVMETGAKGLLLVPAAIALTTKPAGTDISLAAATLVNFGNVTSNRDLILASDNLSNFGIMTTSRDLDISSFTAGRPLTIGPSNGLVLTAARDINFGYNNASQIAVNGATYKSRTQCFFQWWQQFSNSAAHNYHGNSNWWWCWQSNRELVLSIQPVWQCYIGSDDINRPDNSN